MKRARTLIYVERDQMEAVLEEIRPFADHWGQGDCVENGTHRHYVWTFGQKYKEVEDVAIRIGLECHTTMEGVKIFHYWPERKKLLMLVDVAHRLSTVGK